MISSAHPAPADLPLAGGTQSLRSALTTAYEELRRLAQYYLGRERIDHTLQATALVHEAYLRLAGRREAAWDSDKHFVNSAAREMRRVLVDHARSHGALRRGAGKRVRLDEEVAGGSESFDLDMVALEEVLQTLARVEPRKAKIVELRFFGGLTIQETAQILGISVATVIREWRMARAWLHLALRRRREHGGSP